MRKSSQKNFIVKLLTLYYNKSTFFAFNNSVGSYLKYVPLCLQTLSPIRPFVSVAWTNIRKPRSTIFMILNIPLNTTLDINM